MIGIYRLLTRAAYAVIYVLRRHSALAGRELWRGRLGLIPDVGDKDVWIHAASVGETRVVGYLVNYLRGRRAGIRIHVTVVTEAGFNTAVKLFPPEVTVSYFPLDARRAMARTFDMIRPKLLAVAETEIWPNLVLEAAERRVPLILVNGRMSARAYRRYRLVRKSLARLLVTYDRFFLKTDVAQRRFAYFSVSADKSMVAGDMKFDAPLQERSEGRIKEIRYRVGVADDEFLVVAGSTRSGEEAHLLGAYRTLKATCPKLRLLLAPRHVERTDEITALLKEHDQPYYRYGTSGVPEGVIVLDRMGLLNELYLAGDIAFVGGTLVDRGGHNLLEPVWAGRPVLFGPFVSNVREAAEYILEHGYGARVSSGDDLLRTLTAVVQGDRTFRTKTTADLVHSAAAVAGDYILEKLRDV
ncbi:MAG TPA: glycosyltransferase N-terminal domain-containing protein [Acidobacteriota bacterium]|nr:glycosyltransferase N-terminal domain-containing protein [Acidobacteriota bacterium]